MEKFLTHSKLNIKVSQNVDDCIVFCNQALNSKLYKDKHLFEIWFKEIPQTLKNQKTIPNLGNLPYYIISLAYMGDKPVGVVLIYGYTIGAFVNSQFRKNGIATEMINEIKKTYKIKEKILYQSDDAIAIEFFSKNKIQSVENENIFNILDKKRKIK